MKDVLRRGVKGSLRPLRYIPIGTILAAFLALSGCTTVPAPETPREQLAAVEIAFTGLVDQATVLKPQMSEEQKRTVGVAIAEIDRALDAAHVAIRAGADHEQFLILAQQGLRRLRILVQGASP